MVTSWWMRGSRKASQSTPPVAPAGVCRRAEAGAVPVLGPSAIRGRPADKKLPQPVVDGGLLYDADSYLCMEQYMMAAKAELFGDKEIRDQI